MSQCVSIMLVAGALVCSRVAKVSVCPEALLALREEIQARYGLLKEACWHKAEVRLEAFEQHQVFPCVCLVETFALLSLNQHYPLQAS